MKDCKEMYCELFLTFIELRFSNKILALDDRTD